MTLYQHPDIRLQTIEQAEQHISAKRVARLVTLTTFKEKRAAQLQKAHTENGDKFDRQAERVQAAIDKASDAIERAQSAVLKLQGIHNGLSNIERDLGDL